MRLRLPSDWIELVAPPTRATDGRDQLHYGWSLHVSGSTYPTGTVRRGGGYTRTAATVTTWYRLPTDAAQDATDEAMAAHEECVAGLLAYLPGVLVGARPDAVSSAHTLTDGGEYLASATEIDITHQYVIRPPPCAVGGDDPPATWTPPQVLSLDDGGLLALDDGAPLLLGA
jgi:hypothetical protein